MGKVAVDDLQSGMTLAADAVSNDNRTLLRRGMSLTEKHIRVLKTWGLVEVDIDGISREEIEAQHIAAIEKTQLENVQSHMQALFRHTDSTFEPVAELIYLCTLRRLDKMFQGKR